MMAKLTKEQRAALEAQLAEDDEAADEFTVTIRQGDNTAEGLPYGKAKGWLQKTFGIDLDDTSADDDEGDAAGNTDRKAPSGQVKAFRAGRRVG